METRPTAKRQRVTRVQLQVRRVRSRDGESCRLSIRPGRRCYRLVRAGVSTFGSEPSLGGADGLHLGSDREPRARSGPAIVQEAAALARFARRHAKVLVERTNKMRKIIEPHLVRNFTNALVIEAGIGEHSLRRKQPLFPYKRRKTRPLIFEEHLHISRR